MNKPKPIPTPRTDKETETFEVDPVTKAERGNATAERNPMTDQLKTPAESSAPALSVVAGSRIGVLLRMVRAERKRRKCLHLNYTVMRGTGIGGLNQYACVDCDTRGMDWHPNTNPRWPGNSLSFSNAASQTAAPKTVNLNP